MKYLLTVASAIGFLLMLVREETSGQGMTRVSVTNLKFLNTPKDEDDPCPFVSANGRIRYLYYASNATGHWSILQAVPDSRGEWRPGNALEGLDRETDNRSP